ncbi:MAG TPA: hypothetical protein VNT26_00240, partial [Candidatus Sulfotelmatobacter sp.]|nr:hypothetical protein [Candidatus Sulfotelmatobacter sp.]
QRARYWYLKAIAHSKGPEKARLKQRLADRIKAEPPAYGEVRIFARVERLEHITIFSDETRWLSARGSFNARINHVPVGDLKPQEAKVIKNCGATRLFPEGVDFSTAQLTVNHKGKKRGRATLEAAEDHVRVTLQDQPSGWSVLEVTVTFGNPPRLVAPDRY